MKSLDYPTLPRIVDCIRQGSYVYLVMDYLQGQSLRQMLDEGKSFSNGEVLRIGQELAQTLEYLHKRQPPVLYRDMKPDNILITKEGQLKLIDFGISVQGDKGNDARNGCGGTPGYAAPEQFGGICDETTDLYGLGRTLQELSRGKESIRFRFVLRKCTRVQKNKRYQSASEVLKCLENLEENRKQNRRICGWILVLSGLLLATGGSVKLVRQIEVHRYYQILQETENMENDEELLSAYQQAAELCPQKEETYLLALQWARKTGTTKKTVEWIEHVWDIYADETKNHQKIREQIAMLYLCGNALDTEFEKNYEKAASLFASLEKTDSCWQAVAELAKRLDDFSSEIDWKKMQNDLQDLYAYSGRMERLGQLQYAYELYVICGSIYISDAASFSLTEASPYQEGIACYERAELVLEKSQEMLFQKQEIWERLAAATYLNGLLQENKGEKEGRNSLEKSILYGRKILSSEKKEPHIKRVFLREAAIYECLGELQMADSCYASYLQRYPDDLAGICAYGEYLLSTREYEQAKEVLDLAEQIPNAEKDRNYQILKERMEEQP